MPLPASLRLALLALCLVPSIAAASPTYLASTTLNLGTDLSGLTYSMENGEPENIFGGIGSGLTWAGGNTFLAVADRGPNSPSWNGSVDDTVSFIDRFDTLSLNLTQNSPGSFSLTPSLNGTTLLYSPTPLSYAPPNLTDNNIGGAPAINNSNHYYFTGRSDNFAGSGSGNSTNARLDPESIRLSPDGRSVFISDEFGPYIYQFDRSTGARLNAFALPANFYITNLSPVGNTETATNTIGRVDNHGLEAMAITPDGKTLVAIIQSPLIQDGANNPRVNRIVTIDIATGATHEYAYDTTVGSDTNTVYSVTDLVAVNDHEFLVLERDSNGAGQKNPAAVKQIYKIDLAGATDISSMDGSHNLLPYVVSKSLFLDLRTQLDANGFTDATVPAKMEGLTFGADVVVNGQTLHTLYVSNDDDFTANDPSLKPSKQYLTNFFAFSFSDSDLGTDASGLPTVYVPETVPEPGITGLLLAAGLTALGRWRPRRR